MDLQAFAVRQHAGDLAQGLRALLTHLDDAAAFLEVVHAQGTGETRRAAVGRATCSTRSYTSGSDVDEMEYPHDVSTK